MVAEKCLSADQVVPLRAKRRARASMISRTCRREGWTGKAGSWARAALRTSSRRSCAWACPAGLLGTSAVVR